MKFNELYEEIMNEAQIDLLRDLRSLVSDTKKEIKTKYLKNAPKIQGNWGKPFDAEVIWDVNTVFDEFIDSEWWNELNEFRKNAQNKMIELMHKKLIQYLTKNKKQIVEAIVNRGKFSDILRVSGASGYLDPELTNDKNVKKYPSLISKLATPVKKSLKELKTIYDEIKTEVNIFKKEKEELEKNEVTQLRKTKYSKDPNKYWNEWENLHRFRDNTYQYSDDYTAYKKGESQSNRYKYLSKFLQDVDPNEFKKRNK